MSKLTSRDTPKRFIFQTSIAFEPWFWENSTKKGIGGSETSIVEMSHRLAARGYEVIVYAPIPKGIPKEWRGTKWFHYDKTDWKLKGTWIIYRVPSAIDNFPPIKERKGQQVWLLMQDWDYPDLTEKRIRNFDKIITLSKSHGRYILNRYPSVLKDRIWLTSNGIKLDLIERIEKEKIKRNPFRVMYASSPDRGLKYALQVVKKAREFIPDIEFHAFYGFNNLDKLIKGHPESRLYKEKDEIMKLLKQPNVYFHGRVGQDQLMREWFKTSVWIYITNFFETSCITCQEAQATGAIPIFSPIYAQGENVKHGMAVSGNAEDPLTIAKAAGDLVKLMSLPAEQEKFRPPMMEYARERFNWERFTTQWIAEAEGKRKEFEKEYDFPSQLI